MTLLFHVDESIQAKRYHVHLGTLADGAQVAAFEKKLDALRWDANDAGAIGLPEFHGYEMLQSQGDWGSVSVGDAINLAKGSLEMIGTLGIEIIIRAADLPTVRQRRGEDTDIYKWMFSNLLERLNERLKARDEYGLVIADEQHQYGPQLTRLVGQWKDQGTGGYRGQVLSRILDAVHFVDSKVSPMTQLADIAAYVHRRRLFVPTESNPNAEAAMKMLHDLVLVGVPDPTGQYVTTWYG